jgi:hypothetical protein
MQSTANSVTLYLGVSVSKGCIRYSKPEKIDFKVVEMMLKATHASRARGVICGHDTM